MGPRFPFDKPARLWYDTKSSPHGKRRMTPAPRRRKESRPIG